MSKSPDYRLLLSLVLPIFLAGCVTPALYDYTALENSRPRSILVIPPVNHSIEVNAPYIYLASVTRPLAEKGYYVFPVSVIDRFLKENGLPTPAEMNAIPLDKIEEVFGADAVLYAEIEEWGQKYQLVTSVTTVQARVRLVDTRTGILLWETTVRGMESSDDADAGLLGAIVNAIATQIVRSVSDATYRVASNANFYAIHNRSNGLLHGPYFNPDGIQEWSRSKDGGASSEKAALGSASELLHVGKATSEIIQQTTDEALWARSLELAEGDEVARKGIYVKLRSKQLTEEKAKADELAMLADVGVDVGENTVTEVDITGTYVSEITSNNHWVFNQRADRELRITFSQQGNEITGINRPMNLKITGVRDGEKISFFTWPSDISTGEIKGEWTISPDGNRITGTWLHHQGGGTWNLRRTGPPAKMVTRKTSSGEGPTGQADPVIDLTGVYRSRISGTYKKVETVRVTQERDQIKVAFDNRAWAIEGVIKGKTIEFIYYTTGNKGKGKFVIDSRGNLAGDYRGDSWGEGQWVLTKIGTL